MAHFTCRVKRVITSTRQYSVKSFQSLFVGWISTTIARHVLKSQIQKMAMATATGTTFSIYPVVSDRAWLLWEKEQFLTVSHLTLVRTRLPTSLITVIILFINLRDPRYNSLRSDSSNSKEYLHPAEISQKRSETSDLVANVQTMRISRDAIINRANFSR